MKNFFDCVGSRKDPIANIETGHRSACIGHLIIIALWMGRKLQWDPEKETFTGEGATEANSHVAREMRKPTTTVSWGNDHEFRRKFNWPRQD